MFSSLAFYSVPFLCFSQFRSSLRSRWAHSLREQVTRSSFSLTDESMCCHLMPSQQLRLSPRSFSDSRLLRNLGVTLYFGDSKSHSSLKTEWRQGTSLLLLLYVQVSLLISILCFRIAFEPISPTSCEWHNPFPEFGMGLGLTESDPPTPIFSPGCYHPQNPEYPFTLYKSTGL